MTNLNHKPLLPWPLEDQTSLPQDPSKGPGYSWVRDEEGLDPNDTHINGICCE